MFLMGPTGITKTSLAPYGSSGREWSVTVTWSPTQNQGGYHLMCFNAEINSKYVQYIAFIDRSCKKICKTLAYLDLWLFRVISDSPQV